MQENNSAIIEADDTYQRIIQLIDVIVSEVKDDWPTIYKIRYIYLEIGKRFYKDVDFFFSADGKLGESNLSISEIKNIYNNNTGRSVGKYLRVICKSASYILKLAYEKVGIKSELIETNTTITAINGDEKFPINHWLLAIHDDDKVYFATLTPDLPYIQMNMDTRHFGSDIPYKRNYNGKFMQIYKGDEIKHTVLSREELKEIDIAIGYINKNYNYNNKGQLDNEWFLQYDNAALYMLRDSLRDNKLFFELELENTLYYQSLMNFYGENHRKISFLEDDLTTLSKEDWNCWIRILCDFVLIKIEEILGYEVNVLPKTSNKDWNYEAWLFSLCFLIQYDLYTMLNPNNNGDFSRISDDVKGFKYARWSRQFKEKGDKSNQRFEQNNILAILDKMNALVNYIKGNRNNGNFNELFSSLSYHFIEPDNLYENNLSEDGYLSNYYIANKFHKVFQKVFSCNEIITDFNKMGYGEKVTILRDIITMMFPEITKRNSSMLKGYNDNYSAIFNRIQMYPVKSKKDGFYSIMFNILGDDKNNDYYFFYNTKTNEFKISNVLDIYSDYIIVSNRMKNRISIEDLEKIDIPVNRVRR